MNQCVTDIFCYTKGGGHCPVSMYTPYRGFDHAWLLVSIIFLGSALLFTLFYYILKRRSKGVQPFKGIYDDKTVLECMNTTENSDDIDVYFADRK